MLNGIKLLLISSLVWADTISLENILEYASQNAVSLKIKETDAAIEYKNIQSVESEYYPRLNVTYNAEYNKALDGIPLGSETIGGVTISNKTEYQSSVAFGLTYDLYHFGATSKKVSIATSELDIKKMEWCSAEKKLHLRILEYFVSARKADVEKKYKNKLLDLRKELYNIKERLYKAGKYSKVDLGDEAIYMITVQRDIEDRYMQYKESLIRLSQLSHKILAENVQLLPLNLGTYQDSIQVYEDTTEGTILNRRIQQKKDEISLQYREQLPSLSFYSSYYLYESHPTRYDYTLANIGKKSWNTGLSVRYNIFEGFKHSANKERLQLELYQLEQEKDGEQHNYTYEIESKRVRINELNELKEHEEHLLDENYKKQALLERLKKARKINTITKINAEYELLERTLNIKVREIDSSFETIALNIQNRGIDQCSQH